MPATPNISHIRKKIHQALLHKDLDGIKLILDDVRTIQKRKERRTILAVIHEAIKESIFKESIPDFLVFLGDLPFPEIQEVADRAIKAYISSRNERWLQKTIELCHGLDRKNYQSKIFSVVSKELIEAGVAQKDRQLMERGMSTIHMISFRKHRSEHHDGHHPHDHRLERIHGGRPAPLHLPPAHRCHRGCIEEVHPPLGDRKGDRHDRDPPAGYPGRPRGGEDRDHHQAEAAADHLHLPYPGAGLVLAPREAARGRGQLHEPHGRGGRAEEVRDPLRPDRAPPEPGEGQEADQLHPPEPRGPDPCIEGMHRSQVREEGRDLGGQVVLRAGPRVQREDHRPLPDPHQGDHRLVELCRREDR